MTKADNEDFENYTKFLMCHNSYVDDDFKVTDHCHNRGKYTCFAYRDCNDNVELNHKIFVVFRNLEIMIHIFLFNN